MTLGSVRSIPVLMYHEVNRPAQAWSHLSVSPAAFKEQLSYLRDNGYSTLTGGALASLLIGGAPVPPRTVVLTFDDGFEDFHRYAMPALVEHGFTATVFVTTGWVQDADFGSDVRRPAHMLSWSQVAEAATAGMEVGAHSCEHPQLDQIPASRLRDELYASKAALEDKLQIPVPGLAYPYGYSNPLVREMSRKADYSYGYAVRNMLTNPGSDVFRLPRLTVHQSTRLPEFRRLVEGELAFSMIRDRALSAGWSVVRRSKGALADATRDRD